MLLLSLLPGTRSFGDFRSSFAPSSVSRASSPSRSGIAVAATAGEDEDRREFRDEEPGRRPELSRRGMLARTASSAVFVAAAASAAVLRPSPAAAAAGDDLRETLALIKEASGQLESIPTLIKDEKWDGVRGVLMEAPLRDCWSKSTPILKRYAVALGDTPDGDELAALEGREDLLQHLRFLDMAVYNNVFNPISSEGTTGASKALIDSYYNDPTREYEASKKAIDDLIRLSGSGAAAQ